MLHTPEQLSCGASRDRWLCTIFAYSLTNRRILSLAESWRHTSDEVALQWASAVIDAALTCYGERFGCVGGRTACPSPRIWRCCCAMFMHDPTLQRHPCHIDMHAGIDEHKLETSFMIARPEIPTQPMRYVVAPTAYLHEGEGRACGKSPSLFPSRSNCSAGRVAEPGTPRTSTNRRP